MAARTLLAGLDIGTTGVKAMIADSDGNVVGLAYREYPCAYPSPGWVEQDVELMWGRICEAAPGGRRQERRRRKAPSGPWGSPASGAPSSPWTRTSSRS